MHVIPESGVTKENPVLPPSLPERSDSDGANRGDPDSIDTEVNGSRFDLVVRYLSSLS
jgi:hypothetical protein